MYTLVTLILLAAPQVSRMGVGKSALIMDQPGALASISYLAQGFPQVQGSQFYYGENESARFERFVSASLRKPSPGTVVPIDCLRFLGSRVYVAPRGEIILLLNKFDAEHHLRLLDEARSKASAPLDLLLISTAKSYIRLVLFPGEFTFDLRGLDTRTHPIVGIVSKNCLGLQRKLLIRTAVGADWHWPILVR